MDLNTVIAEIPNLDIRDRLRLVEALWESIAAEEDQPDLTDAQRAELERRLDRHAARPDEGIPWELVRARAQARLRR
jgi:putative addiction module component (TIGR02574 family)